MFHDGLATVAVIGSTEIVLIVVAVLVLWRLVKAEQARKRGLQ
jgi:hypothetical protein